jgi:hypothetical protein
LEELIIKKINKKDTKSKFLRKQSMLNIDIKQPIIIPNQKSQEDLVTVLHSNRNESSLISNAEAKQLNVIIDESIT